MQGHHHIGLPGRHPDLAKPDVGKFRGPEIRANLQCVRSAGRLHRNRGPPLAIAIGRRLGQFPVIEQDGHRSARRCLSPDVGIHLALENGAIVEDRIKFLRRSDGWQPAEYSCEGKLPAKAAPPGMRNLTARL